MLKSRRARIEVLCERILLPSIFNGAEDLRLSFAFCDFPLISIGPREPGYFFEGEVDFGGAGKSCEFEFPGKFTEFPLWLIVEAKISGNFLTLSTGRFDCGPLTSSIAQLPESVPFIRQTLETAEGVGIVFQARLVRAGQARRSIAKVSPLTERTKAN